MGSDTGIAKEVGDAVHESRSLRLHRRNARRQFACIGIASWGNVRQRNKIICSEPEKLTHVRMYSTGQMYINFWFLDHNYLHSRSFATKFYAEIL
jgi:hypothetical protein